MMTASLLREACKRGSLEDLTKNLRTCQIEDVNPFSFPTPDTLFHIVSASEASNLELLEELITAFRYWGHKNRGKGKGSGINAYLRDSLNSEGYTALHCACKSNKLDYVYVFVKELRFVGISSSYKSTPFEVACIYGNARIASLLLKLCPKEYEDFSNGLLLAFNQHNQKFIITFCKDHKVTMKVLNSLYQNGCKELVDFCITKNLFKEDIKSLALSAANHGKVELFKYLVRSKKFVLNKKNVADVPISKDLAIIEFMLQKIYKDLLTQENYGKELVHILLCGHDYANVLLFCNKYLSMNSMHVFFLKQSLQEQTNYIDPFILPSFLNQQDIYKNTPMHYCFDTTATVAFSSEDYVSLINEIIQIPQCDLSVVNSNGHSWVYFLLTVLLNLSESDLDRSACLLDSVLKHPNYNSERMYSDAASLLKCFRKNCDKEKKKVFFTIFSKVIAHFHLYIEPRVVEIFLDIAKILVEHHLKTTSNIYEDTRVHFDLTNALIFFEALIDNGAVECIPITPFFDGNNILHIACINNFATLIEKLVEKIPKLLQPNNSKKSPLHLLCNTNKDHINVDCFKALLRAPYMDVNEPDQSEQRPFNILASYINDEDIVIPHQLKHSLKLIVNHPSFKVYMYSTLKEKTAELLSFCSKIGLLEVLSGYNRLQLFSNAELKSMLHFACRNSNPDVVEFLLEVCNAPIDATLDGSECNQTPFQSYCLDYNPNDKESLETFYILSKHPQFSSVINLKVNNDKAALHLLCCKNSFLPLLKAVLKAKSLDPNIKDREGHTPLYLASKNFLFEHVKALLDHPKIKVLTGSNTAFNFVTKRLTDELNPIPRFTNKKEVECLKNIYKALIEQVDISSIANETQKILDLACGVNPSLPRLVPGRIEVLKQIVKIRITDGNTLIHVCCKMLDLESVKILLKLEVDVGLTNNQNQTCLHIVLARSSKPEAHEVFAKLLNHSTYHNDLLSFKDHNGNNCLHLVTKASQLILFKKIISKVSDINAINHEGKTALHIACEQKNTDLIIILLRTGKVDLSVQDINGNNPLHCLFYSPKPFLPRCKCKSFFWAPLEMFYFKASSQLHTKYCQSIDFIVDIIFSYSPEFNFLAHMVDQSNNTALHLACSSGNTYSIKFLSSRMNNIALQNNSGDTPLHILLKENHENNVSIASYKILMQHQSYNPNIQNNSGCTVLHLACKREDPIIVEELMKHDLIDLYIEDSNGNTCFHIAYSKHDYKLIELLVNKVENQQNQVPLQIFLNMQHLCSYTICTSIWSFLKGAFVIDMCSQIDDDLNTPLHLACKTMSFPLIRVMLRNFRQKIESVPLNVHDETPLHLLVNSCIEKAKMQQAELKKELQNLLQYDWLLLFKLGINSRDNKGNTVLHYICQAQSVPLFQLISSREFCDLTIPNKNSEIPLIIAQKSGNKEFFLRVLIKYYKNQGNPHIAGYYKSVLEEEAISIKPVKCILTGPPEAGKTSLKQRLLGYEPIEISNSTGISDSPLSLAVHARDVSLSHATISNTKWSEIDCRHQALALEGIVSSEACTAFVKKCKDTSMSCSVNEQASYSVTLGEQSEHLMEHESSVKPFKSRFKANKAIKDHSHKKLNIEILRSITNSVPGQKSSKSTTSSEMVDIMDSPLLSIIDTGGQPELNELLPAFVTGPAINLIVFRLDKPISEHYEIRYRKENQSTTSHTSILSHEEMIFRSLSSIACLGDGFQLLPNNSSSQPPAAFLVATHKDKVNDETINQINEHLMSVIRSGDFFYKNIVKHCQKNCVIFAVNNMSHECKEADTLKEEILRAVNEFEQIDVPVTWLCLSIQLQNLKSKKILDSVITCDECFEVAKKCGITQENQFKNALWFLHHALGILMYFPEIPELKSKVIIDLQMTFDFITEIVTSKFNFEKFHDPAAHKFFSEQGCFTKHSMKKFIDNYKRGLVFPFAVEQIIALFSHLNIVAEFEAAEESKYFMPSALKPTDLNTDSNQTTSCPSPLLVSFKCGYCPTGVFSSLVAHLISKCKWKFIKDHQHYRNKITFRVGPYCDEVTLKCHPTYFEVLLCRITQDMSSLAKDCQLIHQVIDNGINEVTKLLHYKYNSEHYFGFKCFCGSSPSHPAICEYKEPKFAICVLKERVQMPLNDSHLLWYGKESTTVLITHGIGSAEVCVSDELLKKELTIEELDKVYKHFKYFNEWKDLGLELGLYLPTLNKVKKEEDSIKERTMTMLSHWLMKEDQVKNKGGPTWNQLIAALRNADGGNTIADNIVKELEQQLQ